jgi:hypothetical protein
MYMYTMALGVGWGRGGEGERRRALAELMRASVAAVAAVAPLLQTESSQRARQRVLRHYLYFCTSKASKLYW